MGLVLESIFKTFPMRRRSLKARVYFTFHVFLPSRSFLSILRRVRTDRPRGLKLPARGQVCEPSWWRKDIMRTVHGCGQPKYTLALILICMCEVRRWGEIAGQFDSTIIIGRLIIIIVLYINSRMSTISSWLSTKTFAIVDTLFYRHNPNPQTCLLCRQTTGGPVEAFR